VSFVFWWSLAIIVYTYIAYPFVIYLLGRFSPRLWRRAPYRASVSIVMAVHNGAAFLPAQLARLSALSTDWVDEILVVSDGSTDQTEEMLSASKEPRLKAICLKDHHGKAEALNHAVAMASGEILLFVDVRPHLQPDALELLLRSFADPTVGCVTGELQLSMQEHDGAAAAVSGLYWRYEQWIRYSEAAWDSPLGVYGGFYAIRRSLFTAFPSGLILDDMFQPLAIVRQGYRSVIDREAHVTDTWPTAIKGEFDRKVRTLAGNYQLLADAPWIVSPRNRVLVQLISHKLLRLVMPYFLALLLISSTLLSMSHLIYAPFAAAQWLFWISAIAALRIRIPLIHRFASAAGAFLILNAAVVKGLYVFLFTVGPLCKIWTVPTPQAQDLTEQHPL
jgi:cellulose synthase/poly-beta-1,6-N-acetylglucosamine synthase-like glycosyltransferase